MSKTKCPRCGFVYCCSDCCPRCGYYCSVILSDYIPSVRLNTHKPATRIGTTISCKYNIITKELTYE